MYLAKFQVGESEFLQGIVCIKQPGQPTSKSQSDWLATFRDLVALVGGIRELGLGTRACLSEGVLTRYLLIFARTGHEALLRRTLGSFTRLERLARGSIEIPLTREAHDEMLGEFPDMCCATTPLSFEKGTNWFGCDFHIYRFIDDLFREADLLGHMIGYQANVIAADLSREDLTKARINASRIRSLPGVPVDVSALQSRLSERLSQSAAFLEEYLMTNLDESASWLRQRLQSRFRAQFSRSFDAPDFTFEQAIGQELVINGIHASVIERLDTSDLCSGAIDEMERTQLLSWCPTLRTLWPKDAVEVGERLVNSEPAALAWVLEINERSDYVFISYKHEDFPKLSPVLTTLRESGFLYWFDRGIPGGSEWDEEIERKIERCKVLVVFVSEASMNSKYVRREVKFADTINKPILSIVLEPATLAKGMRMLLQQYQMVEVSDPDLTGLVLRGLESQGVLAGRVSGRS